jgi:hypothetical protein
MGAKILILLGLFSNFSFAEEQSIPEFECLLIEIENKSGVKTLFGDVERPAIGLRRKFSGKWLFRKQSTSSTLESSAVVKIESPTSPNYIYEIQASNRRLKVELTGKPPSRQGKLWLEVTPPKVPTLLGKVTCH